MTRTDILKAGVVGIGLVVLIAAPLIENALDEFNAASAGTTTYTATGPSCKAATLHKGGSSVKIILPADCLLQP